jgi:hypothetical protein
MNRLLFSIILSILIFGCGTKRKTDLVENYELKKTEINQVKIHAEKIIPETYGVRILFHSSYDIDLSVWIKNTDPRDREYLFSQREMDPFTFVETENNESEYLGFEVVKEKLNWTDDTFIKIEELLDDANCIGFSSRLTRDDEEVFEIEYGYNWPGAYSYILLDHDLAADEVEEWDDGCANDYYEKNVVLHYSGGAIGMQCFEDFEPVKRVTNKGDSK